MQLVLTVIIYNNAITIALTAHSKSRNNAPPHAEVYMGLLIIELHVFTVSFQFVVIADS